MYIITALWEFLLLCDQVWEVCYCHCSLRCIIIKVPLLGFGIVVHIGTIVKSVDYGTEGTLVHGRKIAKLFRSETGVF